MGSVRGGRPRITAEPLDDGWMTEDGTYYTSSEWIALERRRAQWRRNKQRQRMDPEKRAHIDALNARYQRSEPGRAARRRWRSELARKQHDLFERECQSKFGNMTDQEIQMRILDHEVELRQLRYVLKGREYEARRAA